MKELREFRDDETEFLTRMKQNKIPRFKSIEEEAEFWDTHDTEEFILSTATRKKLSFHETM